MLYSQPFAGFTTFGDSSIESTPFHSVAGLLPSTGRVQSNVVSRRGMKLAWKYAMSPATSAKTVLFDEFVCSSSDRSNAARLRALVRVNDCVSALTGSCISRMLTQRLSAARMIGP